MTTWLVTGASGLLGANAGLWLRNQGHDVIGLARTSVPPGVFNREVRHDLQEEMSTKKLIRTLQPDVILHCAAASSHIQCRRDPKLAQLINGQLPGRLALEADQIGARFIHISTDAVFSGLNPPYSENDEPEPFSVYGETKLDGETSVLACHPSSLVIRTNFFGWSPSGQRSILEHFVYGVRHSKALIGFVDVRVTSMYVMQLLAVLETMNRVGAEGIYHVTSSDSLSKYDFGSAISTIMARASIVAQYSSDAPSRESVRGRDLTLSTAKVSSLLSQVMPRQRDGILQALSDEQSVTARIRDLRGRTIDS